MSLFLQSECLQMPSNTASGQQARVRPLSTAERLAVYCLFGPCIEVCFTGVWDAVENRDPRLLGLTSIWVFAIYGFTGLVFEHIYFALKVGGYSNVHTGKSYTFITDSTHVLLRGWIYLIWTYSWEFSTGWLLRQVGACPWDYEPYFHGHFMGLITAEYAPLWYMMGILSEKFVIERLHRLRLLVDDDKRD